MTTTSTTDIVFLTIPNLVTCGPVTIEWIYNATTPPTSNYFLAVTNIGVNQSGLSRRRYPLASRQSTIVVNTTLGAINASSGQFDWVKVNIPQGWYRMDIYSTTEVVPSNTFNVTNGADVSCVVIPSQPSTSPPLSSTVPSSSLSHSSFSTNIPSVATSSPVVGTSSMNKGAIAGGVVGGVAALSLIVVLAMWLFRHRRTGVRKAIPPPSVAGAKRKPSKGNHTPSDSAGTILPCGGNKQNSPQLSTSGDCASEKSVVADEDTILTLFPTVPVRSYSESSTSDRRPTSMIVKPSFESYESTQSRPQTSPLHSRYPPDRTRRASRKPVPAYHPHEFPTSQPDGIPSSGQPETGLGGGTKLYYIIPDAPLEQRS